MPPDATVPTHFGGPAFCRFYRVKMPVLKRPGVAAAAAAGRYMNTHTRKLRNLAARVVCVCDRMFVCLYVCIF